MNSLGQLRQEKNDVLEKKKNFQPPFSDFGNLYFISLNFRLFSFLFFSFLSFHSDFIEDETIWQSSTI